MLADDTSNKTQRTAVELVGAVSAVIFSPVTALRQWDTRPITTHELITAALLIWSLRRTLGRSNCSAYTVSDRAVHQYFRACEIIYKMSKRIFKSHLAHLR